METSEGTPQVEELQDDYVIPWYMPVLHSSEHAVVEQPDDSSEERDSREYSRDVSSLCSSAFSHSQTNSSDWSCEAEDFVVDSDACNIEDVTETNSLQCDHTARSFVNVFYGMPQCRFLLLTLEEV
jgi:hypothetical protein